MRILSLGKYYYPSHGGIETVLQNISEGLREAGHETTVLCSSDDWAGREEWIHGVRVLREPRLGSLLSQPINPTLPFRLRGLAKEHDLIHLHMPNPLSESAVMALSSGRPVVISYHSDVIRQKAVLPLYRPLLRRILDRAKFITVATEGHIENSQVLKSYREKCRVIPFGVDERALVATPAILESARDLKSKYGKFALFVGRLVGYKGVEHLIRAMTQVSPALVVVGQGPLRQPLEDLARELGVANRVHFLDRVDENEELAALYHACEFLVLPSISPNEAFGIVLIEAMACSKPAIYSRLASGMSKVHEDGVTGISAEPGSPNDLARAIAELASNPQRTEEMGHRARERFDRLYSRNRMVASFGELYAEMIES